jgi:CheY-like chemotaxis protein
MRKDVTRAMVDQAVEVYFRLAYGTEPRRKRPAAGEEETGDVFNQFVEETRCNADGKPGLQRYTLRLGNKAYPFMKLVLQEHVVAGEFFFGVDTHDQMDIRPDFPDYEAWMRVRRFNLDLKRQIETALAAAGLPTMATVVETALAAHPTPAVPRRPTILVVDDEEDEARALERLLRAEGYDVVLAADGRQALEQLASLRPSLIVLDYEMPELDGLAVIQELRRREDTRHLPILLTTASEVLSKEREGADGFLPKPFRSVELLEWVERLLAKG